MKRLPAIALSLLLPALLLVTLAACGDGEEEGGATDAGRPAAEIDAPDFDDAEGEPPPLPTAAGTPAPNRNDIAARQERLIIKDAEMELLMNDADETAEEATSIVVDSGGYIISQRVWTGEQGFRYADLQFGVPVDEFEDILAAFRTLGMVVDEVASGTDVTDEFVDLNSRLTNLEATRDRLRSFLDEAETISETLAVDAELRAIEGEIATVQGRINFLSDRAAFSTITLHLRPEVPTPTPTPTSLPPTPDSWSPGDTARRAQTEFINTGQEVADGTIYFSIVCGPWILAAALAGGIVWQVVRFVRRRRNGTPRRTRPPEAETDSEE